MYFGQAGDNRKQGAVTAEYERKIRYLDYMENGQRIRGAGFVKLERRDNRCNISLQVSGLYRKDHFTRPLLLLSDGEERELCRLQMADGGVRMSLDGLDCGNLGGKGLEYDRLTGLRIPVSEGKEIQCLWERPEPERQSVSAGPERQSVPVGPERRSVSVESGAQSVPAKSEVRPVSARSVSTELERQSVSVESERQPVSTELERQPVSTELERQSVLMEPERQSVPAESEAQPVPVPEVQVPDIRKSGRRSPSALQSQPPGAPFREEKWEQLWAIYPHIHPFADGREYLSFGLSDLVVLPARYYRLVNNSFLLHGFYNFHHLILTRVDEKGKARYFVGVPGNLFPTEKDTAVMFGFENFECDSEPAGKGDFGYYLIQVEL